MTDHTSQRALADPARSSGRILRTALFVLFAALIVLGPFAAQILNVKHLLARPWTMFSEVGVGVLKGKFRAISSDGAVTTLTPLQVLEMDRYPVIRSMEFPLRVFDEDGLRMFSRGYCKRNTDVRLDFSGVTGSRQGWRILQADDLCAGAS